MSVKMKAPQVLERAWSILSQQAAADHLGISVARLDEMREERQVLAVRMQDQWIYPAQQFQNGWVVERLGELLALHADEDAMHVLNVLTAPNDPVGQGGSMMDILRQGDDAAIDRYIAQVHGDGFC